MTQFNRAVSIILDEFEGVSITDDPLERFGLTPNWDKIDPETITREQAVEIYRAQYWNKIRGDALPWPAAFLTFDEAVLNVGPHAAAVKLQSWLGGLRQDGNIGPLTTARAREWCADAAHIDSFVRIVQQNRFETSRAIASRDNDEWKYLEGHLNRYLRASGFALAYSS